MTTALTILGVAAISLLVGLGVGAAAHRGDWER